jgi:hypothetical protein
MEESRNDKVAMAAPLPVGLEWSARDFANFVDLINSDEDTSLLAAKEQASARAAPARRRTTTPSVVAASI